MATTNTISQHPEYPTAVDLRRTLQRRPLPVVAPGTVDPTSISDEASTREARIVLDTLNAALAANDVKAIESCFLESQAYWKDQLALTWHLRTFITPGLVAASLLATKKLRGLDGEIKFEGAHLIAPTPVLVSQTQRMYPVLNRS